jgi:hypothetical protein
VLVVVADEVEVGVWLGVEEPVGVSDVKMVDV